MRDRHVRRTQALAVVMVGAIGLACGGTRCGLGLHDRVPVTGTVACCGAAAFTDVALQGQRGGMEIDLANTDMPTESGLVDAYLTATSCTKLFDGAYPGAAPLCKVLVGPAAPGKVAVRMPLDAGTYRLWVQSYSSNPSPRKFLIDVDIWDESCRTPLG